jgi:two-component system, sensor histidine kinase and response regulator
MKEAIRNSRILVIDDQPANTEILANLLSIKGYTNVGVINDSTKALDEIAKQSPDLLLLDLMMPDISGFDIMKHLKDNGSLNGWMQILVLTADATRESKQKALSGGASDFIVKPFDLIEVELRIKNLLFTNYLLKQLRNQNQILEEKVKERTAELLNTNQALISSNDALREIAWTQSHIVRAPLARLMGLVTLLETEGDIVEVNPKEILKHIRNSATELDAVIRDITNKTYTANNIIN